jgi:glycosyltransferase involved in cell wall biosynthesis
MKVCVLTTSYPRWAGDPVGPFLEGLCKTLSIKKHYVTVVSPHAGGLLKEEYIHGVKVVRAVYWKPESLQRLAYGAGIPTNIRKSILARVQIPFLLFAFVLKAWREVKNADLIHANWPLAGLVGVILKKIFKKKLVITIYGAEVFTNKYISITNYVINNSDYAIYISEYTKNRSSIKRNPSQEEVIYPGVDTSKYSLDIGMHEARKTYRISAMEEVLKKHSDAFLIIGGKGPEMDSLAEQVSFLHLDPYIKLIGFIPDIDLPYYYSASDVFVIPSIVDSYGDTEGLGLVTAEAMACGIPVVGTATGGIPELIEDGVNGFLVPEKDSDAIAGKIIQLLDDTELRVQMGRRGSASVGKTFNWEKHTESVLRAYSSLLS